MQVQTSKVVARVRKNFPSTVEDLRTLAKIPSVSFEGFDPTQVERSAEAVAQLMKKRGLQNVEVIRTGKAHPYVYGEWLGAPGQPTLLLYAHHDVQPAGRVALWESPPFEPTVRPGPGGDRLFGRGTADDKAGILVHLAAIEAWLQELGSLPVNVKLVIEGEEEIGSTHLEQFLKEQRARLDADVLVLTDTSNFDVGVPGLTVALRGLVGLEVEVRALSKTVHSGMWGGPIPDPVIALTKMLSELVDDNGEITIPEIRRQIPSISGQEAKEWEKFPYEEKKFREQSGLVSSARIFERAVNPMVQTWKLPSLTVNAIQASSRENAGNIICDAAWAKVTIRLVEGMNPESCLRSLQEELHKRCPWGLELRFKVEACNAAWATEPKGKAFDAAIAALKAGYGHDPVLFGCGGSIPFVRPFAQALGGAPALLIGVEDPYTNAHGENESLGLKDFEAACVSQSILFAELAERLKK